MAAMPSRLHLTAVTLDRVFDVTRSRWGRGGPRCTLLGLETGGVRHFSVRVDGRPDISPGSQVVALFRGDQDDWTRLVGWINVASGEIVRAYPPISGFATLLIIVIALCWISFVGVLVFHGAIAQPAATGVAIGTVAVCVVASRAVYRYREAKEAEIEFARVRHTVAV